MSEITFREDAHRGPIMSWLINQRCNFRCTYCFFPPEINAVEHAGVGTFTPQEIVDRFDETGKSWWILLTGGEPFLYPNFIDVVEKLTKNHYVTVNSNFSINSVKEFADRIAPERIYSLNAALHIEERERFGNLQAYIDRVLYFQDRGFQVRVEYVVYPSLFDRIEDDIKMLKEAGIEVINLKVFRGLYKGISYPSAYTKEQRDYITENALDSDEVDLIDRSYSFFGKPCASGRNFFQMDPAGDVKRCGTSTKVLFNLRDGIKFFDEDRPCPFLKCGCPYEGITNAAEDRAKLSSTLSEVKRELPDFIRKKVTRKNVTAKVRHVLGRK